MDSRDPTCWTLQCLPGLSHQGMAGMFPGKEQGGGPPYNPEILAGAAGG